MCIVSIVLNAIVTIVKNGYCEFCIANIIFDENQEDTGTVILCKTQAMHKILLLMLEIFFFKPQDSGGNWHTTCNSSKP